MRFPPFAVPFAFLLGIASLPLAAQRATGEMRGPALPAITTRESFDPKRVPAYRGAATDVHRHIDANLADHVAQLQRWVRQKSISAQNEGIAEMAAMLRDDLEALGFEEAEVVPTSGHPGVWGYYDAGAAKTLAVYMMYDVQPVEPAEWRVNPFAGEIVDHELGRVLMARGATNQKGPQRAFLNAVSSILATRKKLPVNLMILAEGEEELGSPHYPELIAKYADRLRTAEGVIFPMTGQASNGATELTLGVKGIVYFELEATGGARQGGPQRGEIHSSLKAMVDAPVLRLVQAIASLTTPDGNTIVVPGYHDRIRPPTPEEQRLFNAGLATAEKDDSLARASLGVARWAHSMSPRDAALAYLFTTTLNVDGIWAGYQGPGVKTILPHKATAKLDSRLVPDQHPDTALALIRRHLDAKGFSDVAMRKVNGYPPAQSSVEEPLVQAAIGVYTRYGLTPDVAPRIGGSAPYHVFTQTLKLPIVAVGLGFGSGAHGRDELLVIEPKAGSKVAGLARIEKFYADLLYALSEAKGRR